MIVKYLLFFLAAFIFTFSACSQADSSVFKISDRKYLSINYDNDFFNATDRYYTQGIKFELVLPGLRKSPVMHLLPKLSNSVVQYGLIAVQDCFTPASIRRDTFIRGDRPYAATMYLGHFKISNSEEKRERLTSEIDVGAIGPCAVCEQEQKAIHKALVNIQPLGWESQIRNDVLLNYRMRYDKNLLSSNYFNLTGLAEFNAGTIYDNASVGANIRLGKMQGYFANARTKKLQLYGFAQGWVKGVAYNGTMQGGLFSTSVNTVTAAEISNVVLRGTYGICLTYKNIALEYSKTYITREIKAWWPHGWGHVNIITYF